MKDILVFLLMVPFILMLLGSLLVALMDRGITKEQRADIYLGVGFAVLSYIGFYLLLT